MRCHPRAVCDRDVMMPVDRSETGGGAVVGIDAHGRLIKIGGRTPYVNCGPMISACIIQSGGKDWLPFWPENRAVGTNPFAKVRGDVRGVWFISGRGAHDWLDC